jgi:uncharacterized coiled-coil DUF342 family protein
MTTLSERIGELFDKADELHAEITALNIELSKMDEIDSIEHLADVPTWVEYAKNELGEVLKDLSLAEKYAKMGGR